MPRKAVLELSRLLDEEDESIRIQLGSNHLRVTKGPFTLTTKLVDGQFPDYDKVVPKDASRTLTGDRDSLRQGFQRASILSNEKYRGVRLAITPDQLTIQANNPEQEEAEEFFPASYNGEELDIAFNVTYLQEIMSHMQTDTCHINFFGSDKSCLLTPPGSDSPKYVVMPLLI